MPGIPVHPRHNTPRRPCSCLRPPFLCHVPATDCPGLVAAGHSALGALFCSNKFQAFLGHGQARLAVQRLGLLLAAVAAMSGAAACQSFAAQCLGMVGGGAGANVHVSGVAVRQAVPGPAGHSAQQGLEHELGVVRLNSRVVWASSSKRATP